MEVNQRSLGIVVPHTHWDRAWYLPFQAYRVRLVEMMGELLDWLERGILPLFVLDGQTVLIEDTLSVCPQYQERIATLVKNGKLKIGPWFTMPDCFLARPESLIRNLQRGLQMADLLGGGSRVGYVPDSFGHFAQLPQILRGFLIDSFLFMRGMPTSLRDEAGSIFRWRAPNGSEVLATFLREGYFPLGALGQESFHGRYDSLAASDELAERRLTDTLARVLPFQKASVVLLPAGGDHLPPRADLMPLLGRLNERIRKVNSTPSVPTEQQDNTRGAADYQEIELRCGSFEDYLNALKTEFKNKKLPDFTGDLLGQADHPLLRNVLSSRIDLKILNHRAQDLLAGVVEPLLAWSRLHDLPSVQPALVQAAWDLLLKNHAHDDICGCSVDDVHLDDLNRFHEILSLGNEIITRQIEHIVQRRLSPLPVKRSARVFVFNPHPWPVSVRRTVTILLPDEGGEFSEVSQARTLVGTNAQGQAVALKVLSTRCKDIRNRYLETTWGRSYDVQVEMALPALGFETITIVETNDELNNGPTQTSSAIPHDLLHAFQFELEADVGDGYSFGPCPELGRQTSRLRSFQCDSQLSNVFHLQFEIDGYSSVQRDQLLHQSLQDCLGPRVTMPIDVRAERKCNDSDWELKISYDNVFKDSRLRIVFAAQGMAGHAGLGSCQTLTSHGQAQWINLPTRGVPQELWDGLLATPTYPGEKPYVVHHTNDGIVWVGSQRAAYCGGVGLHEFEILADDVAPAVAFTLHRAVGFLSVRGGRIRSCQAGPQRATPDAQLQKRLEHNVAFGVATDVPMAMRKLKESLHPCWIQECPVVPVAEQRTDGLSSTMLDIGSTPLELLALRPAPRATSGPDADGVVVRLVNPTAESVSAQLNFQLLSEHHYKATRVLLDDLTPCLPKVAVTLVQDNSIHILNTEFAPYEIQTWKIQPC